MKTLLPAFLLLLLAGCSPQRPDATPKESNTVGSVVRLDPALDALIPPDAKIEKIATGFKFTEGPVWRPNGVLWFSDVVGNVVRQWSPDGKVVEILNPGGADNPGYAPPASFIGPNGMVMGKDGVVLLCQHGNRRIVQIGPDSKVSVFLDRWDGKQGLDAI